jgi:hypothetical protein
MYLVRVRKSRGPRQIWHLGWAIVALAGCGPKSDSAVNAPTPATNTVSAVANPDFAKLAGRWLRPDGGYILEIKSVDAEGKLEAAYFNPSPINVSRARALRDGPTTKVFIELRDVNYPGCTYTLAYDTKSDQLFGQYFQAAIGETYDVAFARSAQ